MIDVVGVTFLGSNKIYYFDPNKINLNINQDVIVETEKGIQFGKTATGIITKSEKFLNLPLKKVIRIANDSDIRKNKKNIELSKKAFIECNKLIKKNNLNMKIIDSNFTFDREQLIFHFTSDSRIDFRNLAKELASIFKTRIELRQIGVRDKAKEIGGIGPCGRILCCRKFLSNFDSVSINMAKNQNLSLSPNKINGSCGRLLCCLNYENKIYEDYRKDLPNIGDKVKYKEKKGKVISLDIINKSYVILTDDNENITIKVCDEIK